MLRWGFRYIFQLTRQSFNRRNILNNHRTYVKIFTLSASSGLLLYSAQAKSNNKLVVESHVYKNTLLRQRFLSYASVTYNDEPFMTGADVITAIVDTNYLEVDPIPFKNLTDIQYRDIINKACDLDLDNINFLKDAGPNCIISYSEFLFLLSVLVKPVDQFHRHFKILDRANSNTLSKEEFMSIETLTSGRDNPFGNTVTTMQRLFFGSDQTTEVNFETFSKFLHGVQRQCLFAEFEKYSDGLDFITDDEFMRLLLRRTKIPSIKKARYIDRLESRPEEERRKLSFDQFCQFMNLLNDFPDFEVAVRMFAITKKPLTKADFLRAVVASTGQKMDQELIDVVFYIFDEDNDNKLGHDEFIMIMKDSIKSRSTSSYHQQKHTTSDNPWSTYMSCVRGHMYKSYASST